MAAFLAMAGAQVVGGLITAISSASAARKAGVEAGRLSDELDALEANRQSIPNLSGQIQNQYANLQVATQGAEFQAEEADISLANTLDTLRATGMGAGGATALAQAALRSKREVGADIARQEAANVQARAAGAAQAQQQRIAQQNFEFGARENREIAKLDRVASQLDQARAAEAANKQAMWSGIASAAGAAAGTALGFATGEMKFGKTNQAAQNATTAGQTAGTTAQVANTGAGSTQATGYDPNASLTGQQMRDNGLNTGGDTFGNQYTPGGTLTSQQMLNSGLGANTYQGYNPDASLIGQQIMSGAMPSAGGYNPGGTLTSQQMLNSGLGQNIYQGYNPGGTLVGQQMLGSGLGYNTFQGYDPMGSLLGRQMLGK